LHKALHCNRSDTRLGAVSRHNSVGSIDCDFHPTRSANDGFAVLKVAADHPVAKSQRQFGPGDKFYASHPAKIDKRAVSIRAIDRDIATGEYRRPRNGLIPINSDRAICYQLTV
jgi:hypothetical protein